MMQLKECGDCHGWFPTDQFPKQGKGKPRRTECVVCHRARCYDTERMRLRQQAYRQRDYVIVKNRVMSRLRDQIGRTDVNEALRYLGTDWHTATAHIVKLRDQLCPGKHLVECDIDHIIPVSQYNLRYDVDSRYIIFNWRNLRPLWRPDHRQRGTNLDWQPPKRRIRPTPVDTAVSVADYIHSFAWSPPAWHEGPSSSDPTRDRPAPNPDFA